MKTFVSTIKIILFFTILTGIIYPLFITVVTQLIFPANANGSLIIRNHKIIGSKLIGQNFDSTAYFSSRPSAINYHPLPSSGSNFGPTNVRLKNRVDSLKKYFIAFNQLSPNTVIPSEMAFTSASGLDPHITPGAALLQVERICKTRQFDIQKKRMLLNSVTELSESPQFLFLGKPRINVLLLNLKLDEIAMK